VVPGLALATTAVVVLLVLDPDARIDDASELSSTTELEDGSQEAKLERTQPAAKSSNEITEPTPRQNDDAAQRSKTNASTQPDPTINAPEPTSNEQDPNEHPEPKPAGKPVKKSKLDDGFEPQPEPQPTPMSKDETWTNLERADSLRRAGNCDRARSLYDEVIAASSDALAIAQAKGGIGLCFEQDRRDSEAASWFDDARAVSPGIDAWINGQRDEQPLPGERKKPSSKKAKAVDADSL
jgi:hypothetical protein